MTGRFVPLAAALVLAAGCGPSSPPVAGPVDLERLLPPTSMLEGWRVAEGPTAYGPDSLYEYLDGGAERYLAYGFRRLVHVRYETEGAARTGVTLDLFDMGGAPAAFGIYRSGVGETDAPREWCSEAYRAEGVGAAWKGPVFVHVRADDETSGRVDLIDRLARHACDGIAGDRSLPAFLDPLPPEGRVPRSERYVPLDLLGHEFLPGGIVAEYEIDGRRARLFVSDLGSAEAATAALAELREHHARLGEVLGDELSIGSSGFRFSESGRGEGLAIAAGRRVVGIQGGPSPDAQRQLLQRLVERLGGG